MAKHSENKTTASITPKQKQVLEFITSYREENGYAPSQQEIAKNFGFSSLGTVQNYLVRLERLGLIQKTWNARRGMQTTPPPSGEVARLPIRETASTVPLPLLGRVAAGKPIEAIESQETIDVPASMIRGEDNFALRVSGDSMIEDGILSGDLAIIKKQRDAKNGQTVVALINNEATIKRFYRKGKRVELHAANPAYKPLIVELQSELAVESMVGTDFKIEGVLVGIIRRLE